MRGSRLLLPSLHSLLMLPHVKIQAYAREASSGYFAQILIPQLFPCALHGPASGRKEETTFSGSGALPGQ